jgi:SagB-type dehydrogenase family enzyme
LSLAPAPSPAITSLVGPLLRHALGLTAWKQAGPSRWSLRANPSSGNLHPTEAYLVAGSQGGLAPAGGVYHYAPDRHALEQRCACDVALAPDTILIALTSIHWREAWKYGERAFRYCQHDLGHAIAAVRIAASLVGWDAVLRPEWSHADIAALTGIDRDEDFVEAEREEAGCVLAVASRQSSVVSRESSVVGHESSVVDGESVVDREALLAAVRAGVWTGRASQLSEDHVQWTLIDEVARATEDPGRAGRAGRVGKTETAQEAGETTKTADTFIRAGSSARPVSPAAPASSAVPARPAVPGPPAYPAHVLLTRRSAVALDGRSSMPVARFLAILARVMPSVDAPWDALWWSARIHLLLFVHRVDGLAPGLYLLLREPESGARLLAALGRAFEIEPVRDELPLVRLVLGDCRRVAERLSCDQEIAADGFFSLGMIADFEKSLDEYGPSFYRHLFWESGVVGQVLYLEAESAGARGTGIGCFYDDPVHDLLGLTGHAFQSLYHFTIGIPVEDTRLSTERGYVWEG